MSDTIFVFDWDDYIFPLAWLTCGGYDIDSNIEYENSGIKKELGKYQAKLCELFRITLSYGKCYIISQLNPNYFNKLIKVFIPSASQHLSKMHIIESCDKLSSKNIVWIGKETAFTKNIILTKHNSCYQVTEQLELICKILLSLLSYSGDFSLQLFIAN